MTDRDPVDVVRERTLALEEELRELDAKRRARAAVEDRISQVVAELGRSRTLLHRLQNKVALPTVQTVKIASPCSAEWKDMQGDDRVRHCTKCDKDVYDLSALSREEADLLLAAREGKACLRLFRRDDGTVLTQDCPVGVRRKRLAMAGVLALGSSMAGTALSLFAASGVDPGASSAQSLEMVTSPVRVSPIPAYPTSLPQDDDFSPERDLPRTKVTPRDGTKKSVPARPRGSYTMGF